MKSKTFSTIAGVIAIITGLYLATIQAAGRDSLLQVLINGIGWYCVAQGIFMMSSTANIRSTWRQFFDPMVDHTKTCHACRSRVHKDATKCKHCGTDLSD